MIRFVRKCGLALFLCLVLAAPAWGAGFGLYEYSARGNALGGTLVARADDPSALAYNPAGITQLNGTRLMNGVAAIGPNAVIRTKYGANEWSNKGHDNIWWAPHFYLTHQVNDDVYVGLGVFSRFGLGTELDEWWPGRYNVYQVTVETLSFNPNVAVKLSDKLSLAVGLEAMQFTLNRWSKLDGRAFFGGGTAYDPTTTAMDIDEHQHAESWGFGGDIALHYKFDDQWSAGLVYRSQVRQDLGGTASYTYPALVGAAMAGAGVSLFNDTNINGKITLPDSLAAGLCYRPLDNLSLEATAVWTRWSSYDAYTIEYGSKGAVGRDELSSTKNWNDVMRYEFGVEYTPIPWLDLRASYILDQSPIPEDYADYMLPTDDRQIVGLGFGVRYDNWTFDVSYNYLWMKQRDVGADGRTRYESSFNDSHAHIGGLSVSYKF
ncbi:MAG: transporter [Desulfovibrionaceae bacterium]|jgi:long-chain fatty acid transport protein|nr:transporter [Desulfovibrionaceae bacterium]